MRRSHAVELGIVLLLVGCHDSAPSRVVADTPRHVDPVPRASSAPAPRASADPPTPASPAPPHRTASLYERIGGDRAFRDVVSAAIDRAFAANGARDPRKTIWRDAPERHVEAFKAEVVATTAGQIGGPNDGPKDIGEIRELFERMEYTHDEWTAMVTAIRDVAAERGLPNEDLDTLLAHSGWLESWLRVQIPQRAATLRKKAAFDLACDEKQLTITNLDAYDNAKGVTGCGRRASYHYSADGWTR